MLKFMGYAAALLAIVIAVVMVIAATRPDSFLIARSISIKAPADRIFALIESPRAFNVWNPFLKKDLATKVTYRGPERGKGTANDWVGDRNVGKGSFEITETHAPTRVRMRLDMLAPMEAHNQVVFTLTQKGEATEVEWAMSGPSPYLAKVMHTVFDMEKMVGGEFEKGLADLKALAEK